MKRILLAFITIAMLGCLAANAQSANRKGFFVDLRGGGVMGTVYQSDEEVVNEYMKGGFDLGLGAGYRWATSKSWAVQAKIDLSDNLSAPSDYKGDLLSLAALLGVRWTSSDFANNKSAFVGVGTGFGLNPLAYDTGVYVPIEIEVGINLTNKIAVGVFVLPKIYIAGSVDRCSYEVNNYTYYDYAYLDFKSNATAGLKLSYRF